MLIPSENGSIRHKSWGLAAPTWKHVESERHFFFLFFFFFFHNPTDLGESEGGGAVGVCKSNGVHALPVSSPPPPPPTPHHHSSNISAWRLGAAAAFKASSRRLAEFVRQMLCTDVQQGCQQETLLLENRQLRNLRRPRPLILPSSEPPEDPACCV